MKSQIIINLLSVRYGSSKNILVFDCEYSRDPQFTHIISFCWGEIQTDMSLSDKHQETLRDMLKKDYKPPFDINRAKETIKTKHQYFIET